MVSLGVPLEVGPRILGEAEELADHHGGKGRGELVDHLGSATVGLDRIDEAGDLGADIVGTTADTARGVKRRETRLRRLLCMRIVEADDRVVGGDVGPVAALDLSD